MIRRSRLVVTIGLVLALSVAAFAYATGADDNTAIVEGSINPSKLDKKKYKPVNLLTGVATEGPVTGTQQNPEQEYISFGKNLKWDSDNAPLCDAAIEFQPTAVAEAACPAKSNIGSGTASVQFPVAPGDPPNIHDDIVVTAFNGPEKNQVRLHTYSPTLPGATPTVFGEIVKSNAGSKFGQALTVPDAPDAAGDVGMITSFNATISKKSKVAQARCKSKKFLWQRIVTFDDLSTETVDLSQKCKRKGKK